VEIKRLEVWDQYGQKKKKKLLRTHLNQWLGAVVCVLSSQLLMEAQTGGLWSGWPGHKVRPHLKNNQHKKRQEVWLSDGLASVRWWVQFSLLPTTTTTKRLQKKVWPVIPVRGWWVQGQPCLCSKTLSKKKICRRVLNR
jgi:hypothetical protein